MISGELIICDFFFFELLLFVQKPGPELDDGFARGMCGFRGKRWACGNGLHDGNDDIGEPGLGGYPVVFGRDSRVFRMGVIDAQQGPVMVEGVLFGRHIVEGRDFESPCFVSLFGVVNYEYIDNEPGTIPFFPAEKEPAALVGKSIECVIGQ
jgi:hypothetical protein